MAPQELDSAAAESWGGAVPTAGSFTMMASGTGARPRFLSNFIIFVVVLIEVLV